MKESLILELLQRPRLKQHTPIKGLRSSVHGSDVTVTDAETGQFLRMEPATYYPNVPHKRRTIPVIY